LHTSVETTISKLRIHQSYVSPKLDDWSTLTPML